MCARTRGGPLCVSCPTTTTREVPWHTPRPTYLMYYQRTQGYHCYSHPHVGHSTCLSSLSPMHAEPPFTLDTPLQYRASLSSTQAPLACDGRLGRLHVRVNRVNVSRPHILTQVLRHDAGRAWPHSWRARPNRTAHTSPTYTCVYHSFMHMCTGAAALHPAVDPRVRAGAAGP